jgi:hypothetical protein
MKNSTLATAALVLIALFAGVFVGGAIGVSQDPAPAEPPKTAYVDFLKLLKNDKTLLREQRRISRETQIGEMAETRTFEEKRGAIEASVKNLKAENPQRRKAMDDLGKLRYEYTLRLMEYRRAGSKDMRNAGIEAFRRLRNLTNDVAKGAGYTQVLNIAGELSDMVGEGPEDFEALQRQLLLSPVLLFDPAHDITARVSERAKEQWDPVITLGEIMAHTWVENGGGDEIPRQVTPEYPEGVFDIALGAKVRFSIEVQKKGAPAEGEDAGVSWRRNGISTGSLDEASGEYVAPDNMPEGGNTFTVTVISEADPTLKKTVTIRLVPKPAKE